MVRAEGLEPSRSLRPNGFSYPLRLSPPCRKARPGDAPASLWSGLYLHRDRSDCLRPAVGAARLVSTPSPPEFSVGAWLGMAISKVSPNLSSSASPVSRRALKLRLSPMRLPIPPRPRGHLKYKRAGCRCEVHSQPASPPFEGVGPAARTPRRDRNASDGSASRTALPGSLSIDQLQFAFEAFRPNDLLFAIG